MKIGINTLLWTAAFDRGHLSLLTRIRSWGFDGVEIARFDYDDFPSVEICRALADNGLEATSCSALTGSLSLISDDATIRQKAHDFLLTAIESAALVGSKVLAGPFVAPVGLLVGRRRTEEEWGRAVEGLASLTQALDDHDVTLAIEPINRFETYAINTAEDALRLCKEVGHPRLGVLYDTFHANIEERDIAASAEMLCSRLKHVHTCENDRGIPGTGHVDWNGLFRALRGIDYQNWLVIESFGSQIPEIATAACIWRDLAPDSEMIASEGVRFLRRMSRGHSAAAAAPTI